MISMEMLQDARRVLSPVINQTPVLHAPGLVPDCDFYLKADCLQKTGAFKLRGAYYKIATLSDEEKRRGVIACSAGNHAQGVGFASRDMKIPATICIPAGLLSPRSRPPAAMGPTWCWWTACMTTPMPRPCACGTSRG